METIVVNINWNNEDSIKKSEAKIERLVNAGYHHIKTIGGLITSLSMYSAHCKDI